MLVKNLFPYYNTYIFNNMLGTMNWISLVLKFEFSKKQTQRWKLAEYSLESRYAWGQHFGKGRR